MAVEVYFEKSRGTIPSGVEFDERVDFPDRIRVLDEGGKTVAIVSVARMQMMEIVDAADAADADDA